MTKIVYMVLGCADGVVGYVSTEADVTGTIKFVYIHLTVLSHLLLIWLEVEVLLGVLV